jgi:hypothetical protein
MSKNSEPMTREHRIKQIEKLEHEIEIRLAKMSDLYVDACDVAARECKKIENDNSEENGWQRVQGGDIQKAFSDYFRFYWRKNSTGSMDIRVICPMFLRGPVLFQIGTDAVYGGY